MGKELKHAIEVREPRAVAVNELTKGVLTIRKIFGVVCGLLGDRRQELRMDTRERLGRLAARLCKLRIGLLPGLELSSPLPMGERDL